MGKSTTLKALADDSSYKRIITINGQRVFIRHASNDDVLPNDPQSFSKFISNLNPLSDPNVVIAFCPNFDSDAPGILDTLQKDYELLFWVIKHSQNPKDRTATPIDKELKDMDQYGKVEVFEHKAAKAEEIANELRRFLERSLPTSKKINASGVAQYESSQSSFTRSTALHLTTLALSADERHSARRLYVIFRT